MGVPKLRVWLQKNFPEYFHLLEKDMEYKERDEIIDNVEYLLIDSNPLIHSAGKSLVEPERLLGNEEPVSRDLDSLAPKIYELYWDYIVNIIEYVKPKKVYIAIDGVAPVAKQNQQRQRRYMSSKQMSSDGESLVGKYGPAVITPGTLFMHNLGIFVDFKIRDYLSFSEEVEEIILSPSSQPGEGEHKILDYIRQTGIESEKIVFYGPDGDLLILGMAVRAENLIIMRDSLEDTFSYSFIEISKIGERLATKLTIEGLDRPVDRERNLKMIDDYVLFASFVGNDFLPKIKMFMFLSDGLELMIRKYQEEYGVTDEMNLTDDSRNVITEYFSDFIESLAENEYNYISDQLKITPSSSEYEDKLLIKHSPGGKLDWDSYRKAYYSKELGIFDENLITEMCKEYLDTFWWVFDYYTLGIRSWEQSYRYHESPLIGDLVNTLKKGYVPHYEQKGISYKVCSPFIQLMTVLPKSMSWLLPKEYQEFYNKDSSFYGGELLENCEDFEYDLEGKTDHYMGVIRLPFCDRNFISKIYDSITRELLKNSRKYKRDSVIVTSEITYSKGDEVYDYFCKYGALIGCKIMSY